MVFHAPPHRAMRACTKKERLAQVEAASKESRARIEGVQKKMAGLKSDDWRENMREKFKEREQEKEAEK